MNFTEVNLIVHQYKVELDVLASAGEDALTKLAGEENILYIDFNELERRAHEKRDENRYEFQRVLDFTNKLMNEDLEMAKNGRKIKLPAGGIVTWNEAPELVEYITRSPSKISELRRKGIKVSFPNFLKYGTETLKSGLIDIEHPNPTRITIDDVLEFAKLDNLYSNQYVRVNDQIVYLVKQEIVASKDGTRYHSTDETKLIRINRENNHIVSRVPGIKARNLEQKLCFDQLVSNDVEISFITGGSGSGKTVIAYAAAIDRILRGGKRDKEESEIKDWIVLFKSNDIIGGKDREVGFLKGSLFEKTFPFMKSYEDAHNLCGMSSSIPFREMLLPPDQETEENLKRSSVKKIGEYYLPPRSPAIEIEHLQFARGRTFEDKVVFVDEAQNYTPFEIKQLIERVGPGSKIFIVGDPEQIDNPELNIEFNGLVYAAERFYGVHPRVSFMHFDQNFRSQSAEIIRRSKVPKIIS